jgi:hypothetical protein
MRLYAADGGHVRAPVPNACRSLRGSQRGLMHDREAKVASRVWLPTGGMVQLAVVLDILKRSWQWLVGLAVVGGFLFAAVAVNKVWLFWDFVYAALALGVGTVVVAKLGPIVRRTRERLRKYPELEAEVKLLREELAESRSQLATEKEQAARGARIALLQGRNEAIGIVIAVRNPVPVLKAVTKRDGQLLLMADTKEPPTHLIGGLYSVRSVLTQEIKGIVKVRGAGNATGTVLLECKDQWVVPFWEHLERSADINSAIPEGLELATCSIAELDSGSAVVDIRPNIRGVA